MNPIGANIVPPLEHKEVHLWWIHASEKISEMGRSSLSADERERAMRVRVPLARSEFIVGRAALRALVGIITERAPGSIRFDVGPQGKLSVPGVEFSVTHSRGLIAIALCRDAEIGIDVEAIDLQMEAVDIARDSFSPAEIAEIEGSVSVEQRILCFYRIWTRKEAVLKARGTGLLKPLSAFSISSQTQTEQQVVLDGGTKEQRSFFVREIMTQSGFVAALAASVPGLSIRAQLLDEHTFARLMAIQ